MSELVLDTGALPVGARARNTTAWFGVLSLIATEASLFAYLLFSYAYCAAQHTRAWLPSVHPSVKFSLPGTIILLSSSVTVWWSETQLKKGNRKGHLAGLGLTILLGVVFIVVQGFEWASKKFTLSSSAYGSFFFTITGFHVAHVVVGVITLSVVFAWSAAGYFNPRRHTPIIISSTYWHFVDVVWLAVFSTFYIAPYLLGAP